jgi:hypothetical protein
MSDAGGGEPEEEASASSRISAYPDFFDFLVRKKRVCTCLVMLSAHSILWRAHGPKLRIECVNGVCVC